MSRRAAKIWHELMAEMAPASILRRVDARALWQLAEDEALMVEAYAGIWKMMRALEKKARDERQTLPAGALFSLLGMKQGRLAMAAGGAPTKISGRGMGEVGLNTALPRGLSWLMACRFR